MVDAQIRTACGRCVQVIVIVGVLYNSRPPGFPNKIFVPALSYAVSFKVESSQIRMHKCCPSTNVIKSADFMLAGQSICSAIGTKCIGPVPKNATITFGRIFCGRASW